MGGWSSAGCSAGIGRAEGRYFRGRDILGSSPTIPARRLPDGALEEGRVRRKPSGESRKGRADDCEVERLPSGVSTGGGGDAAERARVARPRRHFSVKRSMISLPSLATPSVVDHEQLLRS